MYVVDWVIIHVKNKISEQHLDEFKEDFGCELQLRGASFDESGKNNEFEYETNHKLLNEFKAYLHNWLRNHNFIFDYVRITSEILLYVPEKLSQYQITEFENEFDIKNMKYSISCNSNQIKYEFV